ncbi:MAG: hypothetical protein H8D82_00295 [Euryarchaeota archaeon]|nr:hypothetical protein [Euryarchaeota archaeon]
MSGDEVPLAPLQLQPKAWDENELIIHIVERYFNRFDDEIGSELRWHVSPISGSVNDSINELDASLRSHGLRATIKVGEPYLLSLYDVREVPSREQTTFVETLIWLMTAVFTLTLGAAWVSFQDSSTSWFHEEVLVTSLKFFALPMMSALAVTSFIRKWKFSQMGVDVGHFLPAFAPVIFYSKSIMYWPFGLMGFFNQKEMAVEAWPNRKAQLVSGLLVPSCLISMGLIFSIAGILMTSNEAPDFSGIPAIIQLNAITHLILSFLISPEELVVRTVWLHPLALAGQALMTFGWILLIPIPAFPGYRALSAIVGSEKMNESSTELSLYGLFLMALVATLLTSGYTPWIFLLMLGVWRIFSENTQIASGLVIDESSDLDGNLGFRSFSVIVLALFLTFPGMATVVGYENWEEGLALEWEEELVLSVGEEWSHKFKIELEGVQSRDVSISAWTAPPRDDWGIALSCGGITQPLPAECHLGIVDLLNDAEFEITTNISENSTDLIPTSIKLFIDDGSERVIKTIQLSPKTNFMPIQSNWILEPTFDGLSACINMSVIDERPTGNFSTGSHLWNVEKPAAGLFTVESGNEICLTGPSYGRLVLERDSWGEVLPLLFMSDDGEDTAWPIRIDNPSYTLPVPQNGWLLTGKETNIPPWLTDGNHLAWGEESQLCLSQTARPVTSIEGNYSWDVSTQIEIIIPDLSNESNLSFNPPLDGVIAVCDDTNMPPVKFNFTTSKGPPVAVKSDDAIIWGWGSRPLQSGVYEIINLGDVDISITALIHHSIDYNLSGWVDHQNDVIPVGGSLLLNLTTTFNSSETYQVAWLSTDNEAGTYDSIKLNLAAWCRQGDDLNQDDGEINCVLEEA